MPTVYVRDTGHSDLEGEAPALRLTRGPGPRLRGRDFARGFAVASVDLRARSTQHLNRSRCSETHPLHEPFRRGRINRLAGALEPAEILPER